MDNSKLLGMVLSKPITIKVLIMEINGEIPKEKVEDFKDWVLSQGIKLGLGPQAEYYDISDHWEDDILVTFKVYN